MTRSTKNRTKAKAVAVINLIFAVGFLIALGVWIYFELTKIKNLDFAAFFQSEDGVRLIVVSIVVVACAWLEGGLACLLLFAVKEDSFTKCKIWFFVQTVYLAAVTLGFLVDLTSPSVPTLVPIFFVIFYKSVSLWVVSRLVDEMKLENQQGRLINPFTGNNSTDASNTYNNREHPYYYSPDNHRSIEPGEIYVAKTERKTTDFCT